MRRRCAGSVTFEGTLDGMTALLAPSADLAQIQALGSTA